MGYVYLLGFEKRIQLIKIGKANGLKHRINTLEMDHGECNLLYAVSFEDESIALSAEKFLHKFFKSHNVQLKEITDGYTEFFYDDVQESAVEKMSLLGEAILDDPLHGVSEVKRFLEEYEERESSTAPLGSTTFSANRSYHHISKTITLVNDKWGGVEMAKVMSAMSDAEYLTLSEIVANFIERYPLTFQILTQEQGKTFEQIKSSVHFLLIKYQEEGIFNKIRDGIFDKFRLQGVISTPEPEAIPLGAELGIAELQRRFKNKGKANPTIERVEYYFGEDDD